jgi:hypothetical protein
VPLVVVFGGCSGQSVQQESGVRYASDIEAFLQQDLANLPPKDGILFIGSSIFRQWAHLKEQAYVEFTAVIKPAIELVWFKK